MRTPALVALAFLSLGSPWSPHVPAAAAAARAPATCGPDSYVNVRGACVHRPVRASDAPPGATARCRDGSYSFSQSRRGTCSWHGGVAAWL